MLGEDGRLNFYSTHLTDKYREASKPRNIGLEKSDRSVIRQASQRHPDNKVHRADMGPTWGRQDPGRPHIGHMNLALWAVLPRGLSNTMVMITPNLRDFTRSCDEPS